MRQSGQSKFDRFDLYWKFIEKPRRILLSFKNRIFRRDNWYLISKEVDKCKGEIVLDHNEAVKLLGVIDEPNDYYYEYQKIDGDIYYSSCVGSFIRLKGKLGFFEYNRLARFMETNIEWKSGIKYLYRFLRMDCRYMWE